MCCAATLKASMPAARKSPSCCCRRSMHCARPARSRRCQSFFFSVRLDHARPALDTPVRQGVAPAAEARRLRQMYQVGLLGFIREENLPASLKLMGRALTRLDHLFIDSPAGRLCWIGSAAIESQLDGQLLPRRSRKQLFSRLDRSSSRCSATRHTKRRVACSRNCCTSSHWRTAKVRLPARSGRCSLLSAALYRSPAGR